MGWFSKRNKHKELIEDGKRIKEIRSSQVMQWLELVQISLQGMEGIPVIRDEHDYAARKFYENLFDETMIEIQRYQSRFTMDTEYVFKPESEDSYTLSEDEERVLESVEKSEPVDEEAVS